MSVRKEDPRATLCLFLKNLRPKLSKPHRANFVDLKAQQELARDRLASIQLQLQQDPKNTNLMNRDKVAKEQYTAILSSGLALIKQD